MSQWNIGCVPEMKSTVHDDFCDADVKNDTEELWYSKID